MEERESSSCLWGVGAPCAPPARPPAEGEEAWAWGGTSEAGRGKEGRKEGREEGREKAWGGREGGACLHAELEAAAAGIVKWAASW